MSNILLGINVTIGNTGILIPLYKETSLHQPSKELFCSLVADDLFVDLVKIVYVPYLISIVQGQWQTSRLLLFVRSKEANILLTELYH